MADEEDFYYALSKLLREKGDFAQAETVLVKGLRECGDSEVMWMKYALFLQEQGKVEKALDIVTKAIEAFPDFWKLYLIKSELLMDVA